MNKKKVSQKDLHKISRKKKNNQRIHQVWLLLTHTLNLNSQENQMGNLMVIFEKIC